MPDQNPGLRLGTRAKFRFRGDSGGSSPLPPPPPPAPEVCVLGNSVEILDGADTPTSVNHTDFGTVVEGGAALSRTFTVRNLGDADLVISGLSVPLAYSITEPLSPTITPSTSDTFTVELPSTTAAIYAGNISFSTNDDDEPTFNFAITGEVTAAPPPPPPPPPPPASGPEATVKGNNVVITDGASSPTATNHTDFGAVVQGGTALARTFTVENTGDADLTTSGLSVPSGFSVTEGLSATIAPAGSDTFTVSLPSTTVGTYSGSISFTTNDSDENPYNFAVTGEITAAPPAGSADPKVQLLNTTGSTTDSHWICQPFGHDFPKGAISASQHPRFSIAGTPIDYSYWGKTTHIDGSWRFAGFILRIPTALTTGNSVTVDITVVGTAPTAPSVSLADVYTKGINVRAVGAKNLSGTWLAELTEANATAAADITDYGASGCGGGNVAKVYSVGIPFKQGTTVHPGLYCWFDLFVLQDDAGGLHDIRVLPTVCKPWVNKADDTDYGWVVFDPLELRLNTTVLQTPPQIETSFQFTHDTYGSAISITGITKASDRPVVTAPGHGIANEEWVSIVGVSGMTEINGRVYQAVEVTTDTFKLRATNNLTWGTYTSGGAVWRSDGTSTTARVTRLKRLTTVPSNGSYAYFAFKTTTTGTLPDGLDVGGVYGGWSVNTAEYFVLNRYGCSSNAEVAFSDGPVGMGGSGSGTHTATLLPFVEKNTFLVICGPEGRYTSVGVGTRSSNAEAAVLVKQNMTYMKKARGLYPVPEDTGTYGTTSLRTYVKGWANGLLIGDNYEPSTGGGPDRGPIHATHAEFIAAPLTATRYQNAICAALKGQERMCFAWDYTTKTVGKWRSGTYAGTGFSTVGKGVRPHAPTANQPTGFIYDSTMVQAYWEAKSYFQDTAHAASCQAYGYHLFARPEMLRSLFHRMMQVHNDVDLVAGRDFTFPASGGTAYTGMNIVFESIVRGPAWMSRDFGQLVWTCPDFHPHRALLNDSMMDHLNFLEACYNNRDTDMDVTGYVPHLRVAKGMSSVTDSFNAGKPFMLGYNELVWKHLMGAFSDWKDLSAITAQFANFPTMWGQPTPTAAASMIEQFGYFLTRIDGDWRWDGQSWSNHTSMVDHDAGVMGLGSAFWHNVQWDTGTNKLTMVLGNSGWNGYAYDGTDYMARPVAITNGDKIRFLIGHEGCPGNLPPIAPPGCSVYTTYHIGDVTNVGTTYSFKLYTDAARTNVVTLTNTMARFAYDNVTLTLASISKYLDGTERMPIVSSGGATGFVAQLQPWTYFSPITGNTDPVEGSSGIKLTVQGVSGTFADNDTIYFRYTGACRGTLTTTTRIQLAANAPNALPSFTDGCTITMTSGAASGQTLALASGSYDNSNKTVTVASGAFSPAPSAGDTYQLNMGQALVNGAVNTTSAPMNFTMRAQAGVNGTGMSDRTTAVMQLAIMRMAQLHGGTVDSSLFTRWDSWADLITSTGNGDAAGAKESERQFMVDHTAWTL